MQVKICGHTSVEDARRSAGLGADFIGVIVEVPVKTPRNISRAQAAEIVRSVGPSATSVMVIIPGAVEKAVELYETVKPRYIQLHGKESPDFVKELKGLVPARIIKAIHVQGEEVIVQAKEHAKFADALLLDTATENAGGSGIVHDWEISKRIVELVDVEVFLAGGLTPENVGDAIKATRPYGVDAASGVESSDGRKDAAKVAAFIKNASDA